MIIEVYMTGKALEDFKHFKKVLAMAFPNEHNQSYFQVKVNISEVMIKHNSPSQIYIQRYSHNQSCDDPSS